MLKYSNCWRVILDLVCYNSFSTCLDAGCSYKSPTNVTYPCVVCTLPYHCVPIYPLLPTYTTYICFIACLYMTHCVACPYTVLYILCPYVYYIYICVCICILPVNWTSSSQAAARTRPQWGECWHYIILLKCIKHNIIT